MRPTRTGKHLTAADRVMLLRAYLSGCKQVEIAATYGVSRAYPTHIAIAVGAPMRGRDFRAASARAAWEAEVYQWRGQLATMPSAKRSRLPQVLQDYIKVERL